MLSGTSNGNAEQSWGHIAPARSAMKSLVNVEECEAEASAVVMSRRRGATLTDAVRLSKPNFRKRRNNDRMPKKTVDPSDFPANAVRNRSPFLRRSLSSSRQGLFGHQRDLTLALRWRARIETASTCQHVRWTNALKAIR